MQLSRVLAIVASVLLAVVTAVTEAGVLPALLHDPHTTRLLAFLLAAWNASPYLVLAALVWHYRNDTGPSALLLGGSGFVAAPAVITALTVLITPGASGDAQLGLWILFFPILQWLGIAVVVGIISLGTRAKE